MSTDYEFESFFDLCPGLLCVLDAAGILLKVNPAWESILGYQSADLEGKPFFDIVHPDDAQMTSELLLTPRKSPKPFNLYCRLRTSGGSFKFMEWNIRRDDGCLYAAARDITAQRSLEEALMLSQECFELNMNVTKSVILDWNFVTGSFRFPPVLKSMLGYENDEIEDHVDAWKGIMHPDDISKIRKLILDSARSKKDIYEIEYRLRRKDGTWCWILTRGKVLRNSMGKPCRMIGINVEINRIKEAEEKIIYLSYHDQLTGLYNQRFYEEELKRLDTVRNLPLSIIMADVNGLKLANDAFGHLVGDELLKKGAQVFRKVCRSDEIIARVGGDEFVFILPGTDYEDAMMLMNRLIESTSREKVAGLFNLSISFGFATKNKPEEDIYDIFKKAEDSMYQQKSNEGLEVKKKTIEIIMANLFERYPDEKEHAEKVRQLCKSVGEKLMLDPDELDTLKLSAFMHDIGKIAISDGILNKTESLDEKEWVEMKRHSEMGYRIVGSVHELSHIAKLILHHHEHWDGSGYPDGLKGDDIPLESRIISLADSFITMITDHPYQKAIPADEAVEEIIRHMGTMFDPNIVRVFVQNPF